MTSQCAVCGADERSTAGGCNRVGGVDVCDACYHGLAPARVRARGWTFDIRQWEIKDSDGSVFSYGTDARLRLPSALGVEFKCRRKTLPWKLVHLVAPSLTVGESLFDANVYVRSKNPGVTRIILADDGVQSIMMDMLGEGSWIAVRGDTIASHSVRNEYVSDARFSSEMCVLACHIERLRGAAGLG